MEPSVKGTQINLIKQYLEAAFGPDALEKVVKHLNEKNRKAVCKRTLDVSWFPLYALVRLIDTADQVLAKGDCLLCREMGVYMAKAGIPKFYTMFIRFGNPFFVIQRANVFLRHLVNSGRLEFSSTAPKSATGRLYDFAYPHKAICFLLAGYFQGVLEMCGAKNVSSCVGKCVTGDTGFCEFPVSWE